MSDLYFKTIVSKKKCQQWLDLINAPKTPKSALEARVLRKQLEDHIASEVLSNYAAEHAPEVPELEVVK